MQLERGEILGLTLALGCIVLAVAVALSPHSQRQPPPLVLEAAPPDWPSHHAIFIELPDSGGYLANFAPITPAELLPWLQAVVRQDPRFPRGLYVWMPSRQRATDLQLIVSAAGSVGWKVFDAGKSGFPKVGPPIDIPPPPH